MRFHQAATTQVTTVLACVCVYIKGGTHIKTCVWIPAHMTNVPEEDRCVVRSCKHAYVSTQKNISWLACAHDTQRMHTLHSDNVAIEGSQTLM